MNKSLVVTTRWLVRGEFGYAIVLTDVVGSYRVLNTPVAVLSVPRVGALE